MRRGLFFGLLVLVLIISLLTACGESTSTSTTKTQTTSSVATSSTSPVTTATTQANWWDKFGVPKYGGSATLPVNTVQPQFDPYLFMGTDNTWCYDMLFHPQWTLDRSTWPMACFFIPEKYQAGHLAESWEMTDQETLTIHLRQGVYWQNKAPVNGREFTSDDVVFHYDRILGTGHGYTFPSPFAAMILSQFKNVTAVDKYTVQIHYKGPCGGTAFLYPADVSCINWFEAPEWVALGGPPPTEPGPAPGPPAPGAPPPAAQDTGPLSDWKQVVGTGPWLISDFVSATSMTFSKYPDYWGTDPRYPQNQTPYLDSVKMLAIADTSTRIAALRTGKIDIMANIAWSNAQGLNDLNLQSDAMPSGSGSGACFRNDLEPFTDIRVRKAFNMAIDRETIAKSLYHGLTDGAPLGIFSRLYTGYCYDYNDWPQSLKDDYAYNPTKAKELLAEAGFPNGFKTNIVTANASSELLMAFKDYFKDIGVDTEIKAFADMPTLEAFERAGKHDGLADCGAGYDFPPNRSIEQYTSTGVDAAINGMKWAPDAIIDGLRDQFYTATTTDAAAKACYEMDKRIIEQFLAVEMTTILGFTYWQPNLKGYSMEQMGWGQQIWWSRLWKD